MRIPRPKRQSLAIWVVAPCSLLGRTDVSDNAVAYTFRLSEKNYFFWLTEASGIFLTKFDKCIIDYKTLFHKMEAFKEDPRRFGIL